MALESGLIALDAPLPTQSSSEDFVALISCPDCGQSVSDAAPACIHCGRPTTGATIPPRPTNWPQPAGTDAPPAASVPRPTNWPQPSGAASASAQPGPATAGPSAPDAPLVQEHAFFPVATHKFVVMSLCTFGLYELYWCYRNWQRIQERSRENLSPFWRAFFTPLWSFSLFERVHEAAQRRRLPAGWSAGFMGVLYLVLSMTWRLPDPLWLISMFTFAPFIPVVQTIRALNATEPAAEGPNGAYSAANIATMIVGGLILLLATVGAFMPAEAGV